MRCLVRWWTKFMEWLIVEDYDEWIPVEEYTCGACAHSRQRQAKQSDRGAGWTGVCRTCGAFFLDTAVLDSTR